MLTRRSPYSRQASHRGIGATIIIVALVIWLIIGTIAANQRHYLADNSETCAKIGTTIVTILGGPLNYVGANPQVHNCHTPQPSR
jgi:hypothetical protein